MGTRINHVLVILLILLASICSATIVRARGLGNLSTTRTLKSSSSSNGCSYSSSGSSTSISEDKRAVPTGANPLHNK
ncbi:hypothetical protein Syun_004464 [Stephania yunnanensis]|uniref:Uncharacterized protein n=1 Tax=Stephania yunnanensis TaxID=152371 RepID=A0AAP0L4K8_9MAGN